MAFVSCSSPCITTNPISFSSPPPPPPPCPFVCPFLSVSFPTRKKGCSRIKACASISPSNGPSAAGGPDGKLPNGNLPKGRREILLEYVRNVQPDFMELFTKKAPQQVVDAMRQTVANMIGTLPPQFFAVTVTTVAENLAQLMYSVMMTGYMFKSAQNRLELQQSLEQVALPDVTDKKLGHRRKLVGRLSSRIMSPVRKK